MTSSSSGAKRRADEVIDLTDGDSPLKQAEKRLARGGPAVDPGGDDDDDDDDDRHHVGELEVDEESSFWDDWDRGNYHTENRFRREHPDGYRWSCCEALGSERGCKKGPGDGNAIDELYATSPEPELDDQDKYHPGDLEVDSDEWPDHDENCHGQIDTKPNRSDRPDGFRWSCCDELGTFAEGCTAHDE
jgi:hypothetical protein